MIFLNVQKCATLLMIRIFTLPIKILALINRLEHDSLLAIEWFENDHMKLNQENCHLLVSGHKHENIWAKVGQTKI